MYFSGKEKRETNEKRACGIRDSCEKGAGMRDQGLKATAAASRKTKLQKEQCGRLSVLQLFHVGFTVLPRMVFMKRQRMKYLLALWSKLQICKIPHRHLVNYVKEMYLDACCKCGTIIFRHSTIGDIDL